MKELRDSLVLGANRLLNRIRKLRAPASQVLVLVPHCLQRSSCGRNVIHEIEQCEQCGQCAVGGLIDLRRSFGVKLALVSGGRQAVAAVQAADVKLVVAVACKRELALGIMAAFPKPVIALENSQPDGPCKNTQMSLTALQAILETAVEEPVPAP